MSTTFSESEFDWSAGGEYADTRFERCSISGPVILDIRGGGIYTALFDVDKEHRSVKLGAFTYSDWWPPDTFPHVRASRCEFFDCTFMNVWVWAPKSSMPRTRPMQWWWMRRNFTFHNVQRKIYRGDS